MRPEKQSSPPALELPEIRAYIGSFLSVRDKVVCTQVSRSWYASFAASLWRTIAFDSWAPSNIRMANIRKYAHLIRVLSYNGYFSCEQFSLGKTCKFLESFSLSGTIPTTDQSYFVRCSRLLNQNVRSLKSLRLLRLGHSRTSWDGSLWETIGQLRNLSSLTIQATRLTHVRFEILWKLAPQLEQLELTDVDLPFESVLPQNLFPRMRHLSLNNLRHASSDLERWIIPSVNLRYLRWHLHERATFPMEAFKLFLDSAPLAELESIDIGGPQGTELRDGGVLTKLLTMTRRPLQVVCFPKAEIALETIFVLKYHFAHLHEIDIRFCRRVPSTTVRDILTFCPKLQKLAAFSLHARDIIKSLPWVCHRMRELAISINLLVVADIPEAIDKKQQRYIYQRISQLTELRSLDLGLPVDVSTNQEGFGAANIGEITVGFPHREMRPSVEYGLEHLGSLSKLQNLRLPCYRAARGVDIDFVQWALPNAKIF